ncbi:MAG: hypothetical protein IPG56_19160 [Caulobacteraceae bacterium]|nr:hypothetical protein [Caulobacteraceae bacterium]
MIVDASEADEVCCGVTPFIYGSTQGAINAIVTGGAVTSPTGLTIATPAINPGRSRDDSVTKLCWPAPRSARGFLRSPARRAVISATKPRISGVSAMFDWDLGGIHLTSITAYRDWQQTRGQDIDFNYLDIAYRDGVVVGVENFTQETRLQGEYGRVNWLAGLFYSDETVINNDRIRIGAQANLFANALAGLRALRRWRRLAPCRGCQLFDPRAPGQSPTQPLVLLLRQRQSRDAFGV